ncbi:MAG: class I SAM-dependent methyltransferase [Rhodospirillales bacterium]|nr:class I SAM-dependent methyltransferase [Rhodospirillales bacterium]
MSRDSTRPVTAPMLEYIRRVSIRESGHVRALREATGKLRERGWACAPEQGQLLALICRMTRAERVLEVGTFTGYATLWMAEALPEDGTVLTIDVMDEYVDVGRPHWEAAGMGGKIDARTGPATDVLRALIDEGMAGAFDVAYIDANKKDYDAYFEAALTLVRDAGVIVLDNMLWGGAVLDPGDERKSTAALKVLNEKLGRDERISVSMLPLDDGLTVCVKQPG